MRLRILDLVLLCLAIFVLGGSAIGAERLDQECIPGDSVIFVAPGSSGYYNHVPQCLFFCEGRTYFLHVPMCRSDMWPGPPMIEWGPGCYGYPWGCWTPECAPTNDIVVGELFWQPSPPTWVAPVTLAPGGQEGCACISAFFWLEGWYWNGDCWLSVELLTFSAVPQGENIRIEFATASETDNDYFEIWRGESLSSAFTKIAELPSQGNGSTGHHYSYLDDDVTIGVTYWYFLSDVDLQGNRREHRDMMTSAHVEAPLPERYTLLQNYPNPFNVSTEICYAIPEAGPVSLKVYNAMGQLMTTLVNREQDANTYAVTFDAEALPSGIYIYRLVVNGFTATQKMVLLR